MEPLCPADAPDHGPADPLPPAGCQRCGEATRHYKTIEGRDYCDACAAIVRLDEFHRIVTSEP